MPELANKRHEAFVVNLANSQSDTFLNQTQSYKSVYKNADVSARKDASRLVTKGNVKERFIELMEQQGLHDKGANNVHANILYNGEQSNRLKAVRMYHELKGRLSNFRGAGEGVNLAMQLNITVSPSHPSTIEVTNNDAT